MALDYGFLFGDLGRIIARLNSYDMLGDTTIPADLLILTTQFGTRWLSAEGIASTYEGFRDQVTAWRRTLGDYADRRLTDQALVLAELGLSPGASLDDVLRLLHERMLIDSKRVKACACTSGSAAYASGNRGDGKVWVTTVLDGYSAPLVDGVANVRYDGLASELCCPAETMTLECVADSVVDGLTEGGESFSWSGGPSYGAFDVRSEGSGPGPGLTVASAGDNLLSNGDFEAWSGGLPSSWTVEAGTLSESTSVAHRGTSSLQATGPQAMVRLSQDLTAGLVQGRRRYFLGVAVRASASAAGATVRVYVTDQAGSPLGGGLAQLDGASVPTASWGQLGGFAGFPSPLPSTWKLVVEVQGLPSGVTVYVDDAVLTPAAYHGGVGVALTAGATPWQRGDRVTFTTANDQAGKFQDFWRRRYRAQLPSVASGARPVAGLLLLWQLMTTTITETVLDSQVA